MQAVELPTAPKLEALDERLVDRWQSLQQAYKSSPYHLGSGQPPAVCPAMRNVHLTLHCMLCSSTWYTGVTADSGILVIC